MTANLQTTKLNPQGNKTCIRLKEFNEMLSYLTISNTIIKQIKLIKYLSKVSRVFRQGHTTKRL
jgi:hypothetical protein